MGKEDDEGKSSSCNWHRQRHVIVLASLGGVLAATVVVVTISVVLQPAHVGFTLERATMLRSNGDSDNQVLLKLTVKIVKNTTSGGNVGAKVKYKSVLIYLETASKMGEAFEVTLKQPPPRGYLNGTAEVIINAEALLLRNDNQSQLWPIFDSVVYKVGVTVVILAQVSFQIGVVKTGSYDITFSRPGVVFDELAIGGP